MKRLKKDDYGLGYEHGYSIGKSDGWTAASAEIQTIYEDRIRQLYAEMVLLEARIDHLARILEEGGE